MNYIYIEQYAKTFALDNATEYLFSHDTDVRHPRMVSPLK